MPAPFARSGRALGDHKGRPYSGNQEIGRGSLCQAMAFPDMMSLFRSEGRFKVRVAGRPRLAAGWVLDREMTAGATLDDTPESMFEKFYLEHYGRVVSVLFRLTSSRAQAEELANEVFWRLYRQELLSNSDGNLSGWLYRTATNLGIDLLRKDARRRQHEDEAARWTEQFRVSAGPLDEILRAEKRQAVRRALAEIKPVQAQALILRASGFSYHEIAATLGVKRVSIGTLLLRAEQAFRKRYRARGVRRNHEMHR